MTQGTYLLSSRIVLGDDLRMRPYPEFLIHALLQTGRYINQADVLIRVPHVLTLDEGQARHLLSIFTTELSNSIQNNLIVACPSYAVLAGTYIRVDVAPGAGYATVSYASTAYSTFGAEMQYQIDKNPQWREKRLAAFVYTKLVREWQ